MENQFVPYELAVKLKELGFDEPCLTKYGMVSKRFYDNYVPYKNSDDRQTPEGTFYNDLVSAPLWQQAFDWFREKHGLFPFEDHRCNSYDGLSKTYWFAIKQFKEAPFGSIVKVGLIQLGCFKTYESARLACLEKLIELTP